MAKGVPVARVAGLKVTLPARPPATPLLAAWVSVSEVETVFFLDRPVPATARAGHRKE